MLDLNTTAHIEVALWVLKPGVLDRPAHSSDLAPVKGKLLGVVDWEMITRRRKRCTTDFELIVSANSCF
jgi:hypothetical protein